MNEPVRKTQAQNLREPAPIERTVPDHRSALRISTRTTTNIREMYHPMATDVKPHDVIKILNGAGVRFTLLGAHGIAGWMAEPRATQDVDVLIHVRHRKAVQAVKKAYPNLIVQDLPAVARFLDPSNNLAVIDLMKPQTDLHKAVPKNTHQIGKTHQIPDLEMALALKYAAMTSPNRSMRKRDLDQGDFRGMVIPNYEIIDTDKLFSLGEMVRNGGGKQILRLVEDAKADRPFRQ